MLLILALRDYWGELRKALEFKVFGGSLICYLILNDHFWLDETWYEQRLIEIGRL